MKGGASAPRNGIDERAARNSFRLATPECCHAARAAAIEKIAHCIVSDPFFYGRAGFCRPRAAGQPCAGGCGGAAIRRRAVVFAGKEARAARAHALAPAPA
ncbi:hypothetical protein F7R13_35190, partial [Burkholderia territorii]